MGPGRAGIDLTTPGSAVRLASVARHVTDCATGLGPRPVWLTLKKTSQTGLTHMKDIGNASPVSLPVILEFQYSTVF